MYWAQVRPDNLCLWEMPTANHQHPIIFSLPLHQRETYSAISSAQIPVPVPTSRIRFGGSRSKGAKVSFPSSIFRNIWWCISRLQTSAQLEKAHIGNAGSSTPILLSLIVRHRVFAPRITMISPPYASGSAFGNPIKRLRGLGLPCSNG